jgi:hypothetical protein
MKRKSGYTLIQLMVVIGFFASIIVGAILWPWTINAWLEVAGKEPVVVWWQGIILGFVPGIGQLVFILAPITWIVLLFL